MRERPFKIVKKILKNSWKKYNFKTSCMYFTALPLSFKKQVCKCKYLIFLVNSVSFLYFDYLLICRRWNTLAFLPSAVSFDFTEMLNYAYYIFSMLFNSSVNIKTKSLQQKRLQKELLALQNDPPPGMTLNEKSVQNTITQWVLLCCWSTIIPVWSDHWQKMALVSKYHAICVKRCVLSMW